jgi:hypothetical protein
MSATDLEYRGSADLLRGALNLRRLPDPFARGQGEKPLGDCMRQPFAVVERAVAKSRTELSAVDVFRIGRKVFVDLVLTFLHAKPDFQPMAKRELIEVEGLTDANLRELGEVDERILNDIVNQVRADLLAPLPLPNCSSPPNQR